MERTRKHLLATALALAAALILAVPALAADTSEDGYTIVSTADELMAALSEGTQKIRFGVDIDTTEIVGEYDETEGGGFISIGLGTSSLEIDLDGHVWTAKTLESSDPYLDGAGAIYIYSGSITIKNGKINISNGDDGTAIWVKGGDLALSNVTMNGGVICEASIDYIGQSTISMDDNGETVAALTLANNATIGTLVESTITGGGDMFGARVDEGCKIDRIMGCTIDGGILNQGEIGAIFMVDDYTIDGIWGDGSIAGGTVTGETPWTSEAIRMSGGEIGMINGVTIAGINMTGGKIGTILNCAISPYQGEITGDSWITSNAISIQNATIGTIKDNTITAEGNGYGIYNKGTISDLGENTFISGNQSTDVLNDGGDLTITAEGTLLYGNEFTSSGGSWFAQNTGAGGTITAPNATEEDKALSFTGQIRLLEPWGLRVNVGIPNVAQSEIESVKVTFTQGDRIEMVTAGYNADYSQAKGGVWYSADLTGIRTQYLNEDIEFTAVVTLTDGTPIETEENKTVNMVNVLESCAANGDYSSEERAVYEAILGWFTAYQAYLARN